MNATLEIHVAMEHVKILMDLITAFVNQATSLIQGGKVALVSVLDTFLNMHQFLYMPINIFRY